MTGHKLGLEPRHLELIKKLVIEPLSAHGCKVWAFGSRARGDYREFSDLDLLISGACNDALISRIKESLEESTLPIQVDLVRETELADSYREGVFRDRVGLLE
jgi:predicted nucleotidyltransferase